MTDLALAQALLQAGIEPPLSPAARLRQIAVDAFVKNPGGNQWDAAKEYILTAIRTDAELLWELFAPARASSVQRLMSEVKDRMHREHKAQERQSAQAGGGQSRCDNQLGSAPAGSQDARSQDRAGDAGPMESRQPMADRPASPPSTAGMAAASAVARLSLLDTFMPDGLRPIGKWGVGEARSWARRTGMHVRFVDMLTSNLPMEGIIESYRTAEDAAEYWKRAVREVN